MLLVISGKARSGKDTTSNILYGYLTDLGRNCVTIAYADFLKEILGKCFNLSSEHLYGSLKEEPIDYLPIRTRSGKITNHNWTTRKLLQFLGTDVMRTIDPDCWINVVKNFVKNNHDYDDIIITDGRFINEIDWVLQEGGIHIHVIRDNKDFSSGNDHASETSLDDYIVNNESCYIIENNKTLHHLYVSLQNIIEKEIKNGK